MMDHAQSPARKCPLHLQYHPVRGARQPCDHIPDHVSLNESSTMKTLGQSGLSETVFSASSRAFWNSFFEANAADRLLTHVREQTSQALTPVEHVVGGIQRNGRAELINGRIEVPCAEFLVSEVFEFVGCGLASQKRYDDVVQP